jgi:hypothetical protein
MHSQVPYNSPNSNSSDQQLSDLFSQHMTISPSNPTPPPDTCRQPSTPAPTHSNSDHSSNKPVYTSGHYTHSHHIQSTRVAILSEVEASALLAQAHIHPASLTHGQMHLFRHAIPDQRLRLLQLWNIGQGQPSDNMFGANAPEKNNMFNSSTPDNDGHPSYLNPFFNQRNVSDSHVLPPQEEQANQLLRPTHSQSPFPRPASAPEQMGRSPDAEPYMTNGYEMLARREYENSVQNGEDSSRNVFYNRAMDPAWRQANGQTQTTQQNQEVEMEL